MNTTAARPTQIVRLHRTDSTSKMAWNLAQGGAPAGVCVVATQQCEGRGRLGRAWISPPGAGLYFSSIYRPTLDFRHYPRLSLAVAIGVCAALERLGLHPGIKWPNDILFANKKLCGILLEAGQDNRGQPFAVAGIGINVLTAPAFFPADLVDRATSLLWATGRHIFMENLLTLLLEEIALQIKGMEEDGFSTIVREWRKRDATCGRRMSWLTPSGCVVTGTALGLDEEGQLLILDDGGRRHRVLTGDLSLAADTGSGQGHGNAPPAFS